MRQAVRSFVSDSVRAIGTWVRQIVAALQRVVSRIRGFSSAVFNAARAIGDSIVDGIVKGIQDAAGVIGQAIRNAIPDDITPGFDVPILQSGGAVPGGRGQAVPIVAHAGEVVLNQRQQREVGSQRIFEVLHRTGGIRGRARGGVRHAAACSTRPSPSPRPRSASPTSGAAATPSGTSAPGTARASPPTWPPASPATPAASAPPTRSSPSPRRPRAASRSSSASAPAHMGIRLMGTLYDAGSGGVEVGDTRWSSLKVPPGLQYLSGLDPSRTAAAATGPTRPAPGARPAHAHPEGHRPHQGDGRLRRGGREGRWRSRSWAACRMSRSATCRASPAARSARSRPPGARPAHAARVAGKSPEQVTEAGEDAEREAERKILRRYRATGQEGHQDALQAKGRPARGLPEARAHQAQERRRARRPSRS